MSTLIGARNGFGTILSLTSVGSSGTFKATAGITGMNPPKKTLGVIDVTYYNSPDSYDQAIPGGIFKQSAISLTGLMITCSSFFTYAVATSTEGGITMYDLKTFLENGTRIGWKIAIGGTSSANVWYGDGFITDFGVEVPFNEKASFSATITPTGKPTFGDTT